jgi:hypothetical protein
VKWLAVVVLVHFIVTVVHGAAHRGAAIGLTLAGTIFVVLVIEIAPVAGLLVSFVRPKAGGWIVAVSMFGSLLFGFINHFVISSPDHVSHVPREWQGVFTATAVLLVLTELAGVVAGWQCATRRKEVMS